MTYKCFYVLALSISPVLSYSQDFNDAPGLDDEQYLSLIFPAAKTISVSAEENAGMYTACSNVQNMLEFAFTKIGTPYRGGAVGNGAFDCSGFTQQVFRQIGMQLPHSSGLQAHMGKEVALDEVQPGDLLFFKGRNRKTKRVGHVGMVTEVLTDGTIKIIHATSGRGVIVEAPFSNPYFRTRFITARRILSQS